MLRRLLLPLGFALPLAAQTAYAPMGPDARACPRLEEDPMAGHGASTGASTGGKAIVGGTYYTSWGSHFFPVDERKDVTQFAAYDVKGNARPLSACKGKVVVVGFWQTGCTPSTQLISEMASLATRADQLGIELMAVNVNPERWRVIVAFQRQNADFLKANPIPMYTPGLGKEGPNAFMDVIPSLPAFFVMDAEGRLAYQEIGYRPGMVGQTLRPLLAERKGTLVIQSKPPTAPPSAPAPTDH